MPCNCGRNRMQTTSANIVADTAGQLTEGARTLARRREEARAAVARAIAENAAVVEDAQSPTE